MDELLQNLPVTKIKNIVRELKSPKAMIEAKNNPVKFFAQFGVELPANVEYEIHFNDDKTYYFVMFMPSNETLTDEQIREVYAARSHIAGSLLSTASTASTASCPSSFATVVLSTASSFSSA